MEPKTKSPGTDGNRDVARPVMDVVRPQLIDSSQPQAPQVFARQPESLGVFLPGESLDDATDARTVVGAPTSLPLETYNSKFSVFHFNRRAFSITVAGLTVLGLLGVLSIVLAGGRHQNNTSGTSKASNFAVKSIPVNDGTITAQLGVGSADKLSINGELRANNGFVLAPTAAPTSPTAGQVYLSATDNQLYYYNGSGFKSLATTDSLTGLSRSIAGSGLVLNGNQLTNAGVLSVQGQSGAINFSAGEGISVNGTTITNSGVVTVTGANNQITVSQANGQVVLGLPQNISPAAVPSFAGLHLSSALDVLSGGTGSASLAADQLLLGNGTAAIGSVSAGNLGECLISNGSGVAPSFQSCGGSGGGATVGTATVGRLAKFTSSNTLSDSLLSEAGSVVTVNGDLFVTGVASGNGSGLAALNATNLTTGTVNDLRLSANVTLAGNTYNGISQLVQLNGSGQLPVISGANLTNLNAANITSGTLAIANGGTGAGTAAAARANLGAAASGTNSDITSLNGLASITGTGAVNIAAGGTNQNLTLQASGTGSVIINGPTFHNTNGATYAFNAADAVGVSATICTTQGNCTGASGGGIVSTGTSNAIALFGSDGYHLGNSLLSQDFPATTVTVGGALVASGTINGATISGGSLTGGTVSGGSLSTTAVNGLTVSGTAITGSADLTISAGGSNQNLTLKGSGTGTVAVTGNFTASGTINGATISGGNISGGSFNGATISGGSLSATAVNGLGVSGTAITASGALNISAGGSNQNLTLQGSGTGVVTVSGNFTASGTINGATISGGNISGGSFNGATISGGSLTASAVNSLNVSGTAITGTAALTVSAGGTNQNLTLQASGSGSVVVKVPTFSNANGATYSFDPTDLVGTSATICTSLGNCTGGASVSSTGTSNSLALYGSDGNHLVDSILSQDVGATTVTAGGNLAASGTINGATISGGTISGGSLTATAVNNLSVSGTAITGTGALAITAGGSNQNLSLSGTGTGNVVVGSSLLQGTGALGISAGGSNQNLTLSASGTGSVIINTPTFHNANGATYSFDPADLVGASGTVCTSLGNCTGASGGGVVSSGTTNAIAVFGSDGYHLANSILSQDVGATTLTIGGTSVVGASALSIAAGGTNQNLTLQGSGTGSVLVKVPTFSNANGATYSFDPADLVGASGTVCTSLGNCTGSSGGGIVSTGTSNAIALFTTDGYHLGNSLLSQDFPATTLTVAGNFVASGSINTATISGGTLSGGSVSGGTLTSSTVNSLNVSGTAISGTGALSLSAGGSNQNLTLQGSGTGVVAVTGNFTASGTINGATISGGNISGGSFNGATISGGSLTASTVNSLNVSGTAISGTGALSLSAGGSNQNLTLQGSGTGAVIVNTPTFHNANGATYAFNAADISAVNATICTSQANCIGAGGGGVVSTGGSNSIPVFTTDGYHLANSILSQDVGATTATVAGDLVATGTINGATISGGNISGGSFNGASITGGSLSASAVNGLNVSGTAITGSGALAIAAGGSNQNLTLQGSGTGVVAVTGNLTVSGTINSATISGGTLSGGTFSGGSVSGGSLTSSAVNGLSVSASAIAGSGALSLSAGGTNQNLTLQGSGTGVVAVTGNLTASGTINGATLSGGTISGGTISGGTLTSSAVNGLNVSGTAITGSGALSIAAGGSNQNLTLQGSGTGSVVINTPTFHNANGATYTFNPADISSVNASICTSQGNCVGAGGGGISSSGTQYSIPVFGIDGYHFANSILTQDPGATTLTVSGSTIVGSGALAVKAATAVGTNTAGSALTIAGGPGTGNANSGDIVFQYAKAGASGSTANSLQTACTISGADGALSCPGAGGGSEHFGSGSSSAGSASTAFGGNAAASNLDSTAIGFNAIASNNYATAVGQGAFASGQAAVALGRQATSTFTNSIALGVGATTTATGQLVVGADTFGIQNVFIGNGVTNATPSGVTLQASGGRGTDIAGASVSLAGGVGTGLGNGGNINFQIAKAAGSTSNTANTLTTVASLSGVNGAALFQNSANSTTGFQIQNAAGTSNLLVADTINTKLGVGKLPSAGGTTLQVSGAVDATTGFSVNGTAGATVAPCSGGQVINPTVTNGIITAASCVANASTIQQAYTASTGGTTPEIKLDATRGALDIQDADSTIGNDLFNVLASNGSGLGNRLFTVNSTNGTTISGSTYSTGTISQSTTTITGSGTTFTIGMTGGTIYYSDGTTATITYNSATSLTSSVSKTVTAGNSYTIVYGGLKVAANGTTSLQNASNSTSAFSIQNATGTSIFNVDTTNGIIGSPGSAVATGTTSLAVKLQSGTMSGFSSGSGAVTVSSGNGVGVSGFSGNLTLATGTGGASGSSGNITLDVGSAGTGGTTGTISIGATNASAITIGKSGATATINTNTAFISNATTQNALSLTANGLTTGTGLQISTVGQLSSGNMASILQNSVYSNSLGFTGNDIKISRAVTVNNNVTNDNSFAVSGSFTGNDSFSYTVNNVNGTTRAMVLTIVTPSTNTTPTAVTYNGVSLSLAGSVTNATGASKLWMYTLASPATGTNTLAVTWTAGQSATSYTVSDYYNVDPTTPFGTFNSNTTAAANSISTSVTTTAGGAIVDGLAYTPSPAWTPSYTSLACYSFIGSVCAGQYRPNLTAGSNSVTWTNASSVWAAQVAIPVNAQTSLASTTSAITGAVASFSSNCTITSGLCSDSSNILSLNQQYASATGAVLNILNSGSGAELQLNGKGGIAQTYTGTTGTGYALTSSSLTTGSLIQATSSSASLTSGNLVVISQTSSYTDNATVSNNELNASRVLTSNTGAVFHNAVDFGTSTSTSPAVWNHTVGTNNNRLLMVFFTLNSTAASPTVTYGGNAMTLLTSQNRGDNASKDFVYYLINPTSGSASVSVSWTGSLSFSGYGGDWSNVNQTTPLGTPVAGSSAGTTSISLTPTTQNGGMGVDFVDVVAGSGALVPGASQTPVPFCFSTCTSPTGTYKTSVGTSTNMSWSWPTSKAYGAIAVGINPISAGITLNGAVANLASNCVVTGGFCTDSANILNLNQQYASASGAVLSIQNAGTGADILIGSTNTGQIQTAGGTTTKGINIQSGVATAGASGAVSLQSGGGTTSTGVVSILSGNASAGAAGGITVDTGTFTSGTPTISIGTANASAVSIGRTGQATTVNGTLTVTQAVTFTSTLAVKDVTINGHITTGNSSGSTTAAVNANAGTSGSCTINGNDTAGQITLVTGSGSWAAGTQCTVTFANSYATNAPHPVITPANSTDTTLVKPYVDVPGSTPFTTWTLNFIVPDTGANTYKFNYFNAQ